MKETIHVLLGLLLFSVATSAHAQFTYITNNGTITITGYTGSGGAVTIPANINGLTVTSIGTNAFENDFGVDSIMIPATVTNIGDNAFANCGTLGGVTFPGSGLLTIGSNAFYGCNFTQFTIPSSVTTIGSDAFYYCFSMANITIPNSVTSLGEGAFGITFLGSVTIPSNVVSISGNPFPDCIRLTNINVAAGNPAFVSVSGVLFNQNQTELVGCPSGVSAASYNITNSVTSIANEAFSGCEWSSVAIPASVHSIGYRAFFGSRLTNIAIPYSVTNIGDAAFGACGYVSSISVDTNNPAYESVGNVLFDKNEITLIEYPAANATNFYSVPDSVTNIADFAFAECDLSSVTLDDSLTGIGESAFYECQNLTNVVFPDSLITIGDAAFFHCYSLRSVTLPNSLLSAGEDAFASCQDLTSATVPGSLTNFGVGLFTQCYSLTNITLGYGLTIIAPNAIESCTSLTSVTIPSSVTNIGSYAFYSDPKLTAIYYEGNAPSVGQFFAGSPSTNYYLPNAVGWSSPFNGVAAALWTPAIRTTDGFFGVQSNQFGFNISWASNESVTVQASPGLTSPSWTALTNVTLTNGLFYFSDANWTNFPGRYYRVSWP